MAPPNVPPELPAGSLGRSRTIPLVVVASASHALADKIAAELRRTGSAVYSTYSAQGCLRVATSVAPDVVVLDRALPRRLAHLLRAHPASARARIRYVNDELELVRRAEPALDAAA